MFRRQHPNFRNGIHSQHFVLIKVRLRLLFKVLDLKNLLRTQWIWIMSKDAGFVYESLRNETNRVI